MKKQTDTTSPIPEYLGWWNGLTGGEKPKIVFGYFGSYNASNLLDWEIKKMFEYYKSLENKEGQYEEPKESDLDKGVKELEEALFNEPTGAPTSKASGLSMEGYTGGLWAIRDNEIIGGYGSNKSICEMTGNFMSEGEKKANAQRIVTSVNNHDAMKELLEYIVKPYPNIEWVQNKSKEVLNTINNNK